MKRLWLAFALLSLGACQGEPPRPQRLSVAEALGGDPGDFERVLGPREFAFPADHGAHPEYRTEWWYFTGNLAGPAGERYGFHFTLFRTGLARELPERAGQAADAIWMGHFAVADGERRRVHAFERFARGGTGLAGSLVASADTAEPTVRIWIEDWSLEGIAGMGEKRRPTWRLTAREGDLALELELVAAKPIVLQGDAGFSVKGAEPGSASYYYAVTRFDARGSLTLDGRERAVQGLAWKDREWSTSLLEEGQVGWDWFALQLEDGRDLMVYRMRTDGRRGDGGVDATSHGALLDPDGRKLHLSRDEFEIEDVRHFTSPRTGGRYPVAWRIAVPGSGLDLEVEALFDDQELDLSVAYWEGAVVVRGRDTSRSDSPPVAGRGYAEMTGYATAERAAGDSPPVRSALRVQ